MTETDAVPPAVRLIRDFVNTVEWQTDEESWRHPADLGAWFAENSGWRSRELDFDDLALARRLREGLRSVLLMHAGHDPLATSIDDLNEALGLVPLRMRFDETAAVRFTSPDEEAAAHPLALILDRIATSRLDGDWMRLKACSRDSCRWAYWDGSRNQTGRWCSMAGCGNYIKMRRRNGTAGSSDDAVIAIAGQRAPTLVDVAGRAGVSIKTVSNVVTGTVHVSDPTRARVEAAIDELGYRPNLAARALVGNRPLKPKTSA